MDRIILIGRVVVFLIIVGVVIYLVSGSDADQNEAIQGVPEPEPNREASVPEPEPNREASAPEPKAANDDAWKCNSDVTVNARWGPCQPGVAGSCADCTAPDCGCRNSNKDRPCYRCMTEGDCTWASKQDGSEPYLKCAL